MEFESRHTALDETDPVVTEIAGQGNNAGYPWSWTPGRLELTFQRHGWSYHLVR